MPSPYRLLSNSEFLGEIENPPVDQKLAPLQVDCPRNLGRSRLAVIPEFRTTFLAETRYETAGGEAKT